MALALPPLQGDPVPGSVIAAELAGRPQSVVETAFEMHVRQGNVPNFLRSPIEIRAERIVLRVLPDVLSVGTDEDFFRIPVTPLLAQKIADLSGGMFPTPKIVDLVWIASPRPLAPQPWGPPYDATMESVERFYAHHQRIETQRIGAGLALGELVVGHKKDIVITSQLAVRPNVVAIYGWHEKNGKPIQGLNASSHAASYRDYSHGIRLVDRMMDLDGAPANLPHVLADPVVCGLVSHEGASRIWRQP